MALAASLLLAISVGVLASLSPDDLAFNPYWGIRNYISGLFGEKKYVPIFMPSPLDLESAGVKATSSSPVSVRPEQKTPSLRDSMAEAGTAMVALTRRTADETVEQTRILAEVLPSPMNVFEAVPPMPEQPIASAWQETSQRVATGFEPVTNSARRALSMLLRENPRPVNQ
jgi:hypothetical protein